MKRAIHLLLPLMLAVVFTPFAARADGPFGQNLPDLTPFQLIDIARSHESQPVDANALSFQTQVLENPGVVVVEFMLPTCADCNPTVKILKGLVLQYKGKVSHIRLDIDKNPGLGARYDIPRVPAVLVFNRGQFVARFAVFTSKQKEALAETLNEQIGLTPKDEAGLATGESSQTE